MNFVDLVAYQQGKNGTLTPDGRVFIVATVAAALLSNPAFYNESCDRGKNILLAVEYGETAALQIENGL